MNLTSRAAAVALTGRHGKVRLKWHKLRRTGADAPFRLDRLAEGIGAEASVEVDIRTLADGHWVVLHDDVLEGETTGTGPVASATRGYISELAMRRPADQPQGKVLLLDDLVGAVGCGALPQDFLLQLDLKIRMPDLTAAAIEHFIDLVTPIARHCVVGCHDWAAVAMVCRLVPGLRAGYDPLESLVARQPIDGAAWPALIETIATECAGAEWIYLYYPLIREARARGHDIVRYLHRHGHKVDAWTFRCDRPDSAAVLGDLIEARVDQITTDDPEALADLARSL